MTSSPSSLAVVPYQPAAILPLHEHLRKFRFGDLDLAIEQDWAGLGVAAVVWEAAEVLAQFLSENPGTVRGRRIIELGAGTGLVGMATALLGASLVDVTDRANYLDPLHHNLNLNIRTHQESDRDTRTRDSNSDSRPGDSLQHCPAESVTDILTKHVSHAASALKKVRVRPLTWGSEDLDRFTETYDVILGADIVYVEDTFADLLKTMDTLWSRSTIMYLAVKVRYDRDLRFLDLLAAEFKVKDVFQSTGVTVYEVTR